MRTIQELRQYANELGVVKLPPLEELGEELLTKLHKVILEQSIPLVELGLWQKRFKLHSMMLRLAQFEQYSSESDVDNAIEQQTERLFGRSLPKPVTSSLYEYNRELPIESTDSACDLYLEEKAICTTAFYENLSNAFEDYCCQNAQISEQLTDVLKRLEKSPRYTTVDGCEYVEPVIQSQDYTARSLQVEQQFKPVYRVHARLIAQRNELRDQLQALRVEDIRRFGVDLGENDIGQFTEEKIRARVLFAMNRGLRAGIEVLLAEIQQLQLSQPNPLLAESALHAARASEKCDISLQSNAKILQELRRTHTAAKVEMAQLQGALQAEIFAASTKIELKQQDLLQVTANYVFIDDINFGELLCLQGADYSCRASTDEIKDICSTFFINQKTWNRLLEMRSISQIGERCFDIISELTEQYCNDGADKLLEALTADVEFSWQSDQDVFTLPEDDGLREKLAECIRTCNNILALK